MKHLKITVNGKIYDVAVEEVDGSSAPSMSAVAAAPIATPVQAAVTAPVVAAAPAPTSSKVDLTDKELINSPMPGTIIKMNVSVGDVVKKGHVLLILEAMKMENEIQSPRDGVVASVSVKQGDSVSSGDLMVALS